MRIETLNSLTEDELIMLLCILNSDPPLPIKEITPGLIPYYKDDILTFKVSQWGDKVKPDYKDIFDQLMFKISNVNPHEPTPDISGSDQKTTGSV